MTSDTGRADTARKAETMKTAEEERAAVIRAAFMADNRHLDVSDADYEKLRSTGATDYLEPIVDAVMRELLVLAGGSGVE